MAPILPVDHFLILAVYSILVSGFFALLWRESARERRLLFAVLLVALVGGGLAVAWLMYPFPS